MDGTRKFVHCAYATNALFLQPGISPSNRGFTAGANRGLV
ncbi:hypothetical protein OOU_Y34scaffold00370g42 [Pyricularia oryzae Y34]|uniref:Uncharacterized protein n=2 Tax=Pyricularia oryzae TaxID=318829 RepID=A0AA97PNC9_PYRO3|nr:hypothetical protein OOU_Y34scaffold00370g42 [Pyricularia oryzae Y34]